VLALRTIVTSATLDTLTFATQPPASDDWYLAEQRGRILIVRSGQLLPEPFLDVRSDIKLGDHFDMTTPDAYDERGLISLAFAPDYAQSGLFYVAITPSAPDDDADAGLALNHDLVLEYRRSDSDSDRADPVPVRALIDVPSAAITFGNLHNANTVRFGPDGFLYVGMGDGGGTSCNDAEPGAPQDVTKPFGKILRLDPHAAAPPYAAAGNPFASMPGAERVLHYGLRNPFRFSFDRQSGDLYIGDVGQSRYEEIDFAPAKSQGLNFGWAAFEGPEACPTAERMLRDGSTATKPIFTVDRRGNGPLRDYRAIVGGAVYRGKALPQLAGVYVFGDYYGTRLGALQRCGDATSPNNVIRKNCDPNFPEPCLQADASAPEFKQLTAIVEDHTGELYLVANGNSLLQVVPGQ
jgi:glucose/arabinose dehydrogenase